MEDPWANAWGEPAKPKQSWSNPAQSSLDAEADIAMPSWGSGAAVHWSEPSEQNTTIWHPSEPAKGGWASTYEDLPLGKSDTLPVLDIPSSPQVIETTISSPESPPSPSPTSEPVLPTEEPESRSRSPTPRSASPDAFGTFETGLDADDPWAAGSVASPDAAEQEVWVPSWGAPDHAKEDHNVSEPVDEWEEAKRQKARQDEHVPPEVLASILDDFTSLSNDVWPARTPPQDLSDARSGMEGVEGLSSIANRLIPHDLTLPSVQFPKTFTAKHMGDSLRLSRHVPITRLSPFTMYMASKGSTAWETSVKSRIDLANDDLLPPGWRVVDKDKEEPAPAVDTKKKTTGGLLSFFGRRPSNVPLDITPRRSESPSRAPSSVASSNVATSSPVAPQSSRTSFDSAKSPIRSSTPISLGASAVIPAPVDITPTVSAPYSQTPTTSPEVFEQPQGPSAVSRFLTRFSRSKTAGPGSKDSLALSTDDLEFLSDIVPSANDDADEADQLRGLSNMLSSSPLATALPPLLPAPPRLPPPNITSQSFLPQRATAPTHPQDDLFSLFDSPPASKSNTTQPAILPPQSATSSIAPTFPPPTNTFYRTESQGPPASSHSAGRSSSSFDTSAPSSRSHTPLSMRRTPMAIMSTGSPSTSRSGSSVTLPPPPILAPPLRSKPSTPSHSRAPSQQKAFEDDDDLANFRSTPVSQPSLLSDTSTSSIYSDQSLISDTSSLHIKPNNEFFDDFDDFVSSPIRDPSPPRPPAKPSLLAHKPLAAQPTVLPQQTLPQPLNKHPSPPPRRGSRAADHQRTMSLVNVAAARTGRWPAPPSPLPELLPPPPDAPASTSSSGGSLMQAQQQKNIGSGIGPSISSPSAFPFLPPPPGFAGLRTTMSPSPPPQLRTESPAPVNRVVQNGRVASPAPPVKYTPSATPAASGGLSAQDLSFFEGL
ncbi:hypothetical protein DXG01_012362 [Tephrocybe rancida]|nr:hypothetical protein DXG01_012362 [Tephrocybe rancida]